MSYARHSSDLPSQGGYLPPSDSLSGLNSTSNASSTITSDQPRLDWALERESEIMRLEAENKALREMLGLSGDVPDEEKENGGGEAGKKEVGR